MKRTRSAELLYRLSRWRELYLDLHNMPIYCLEREISIEDAKRIFGFTAHPAATSVAIGYTVYQPMEASVDAWPTMPKIPQEVYDELERLNRGLQFLTGADPQVFKERKS